MSAYADLDLDTPNVKSKGRKLKSQVSALADDARSHLSVVKDKGLELANASSAKAAEYARYATDHAKRKPVSTGLIALAAGIGLVFIFSRSARSAVMSVGEDLWGRYSRR